MRTSRRVGDDSIESIPGSGVMQFFGFSLVYFRLVLYHLVDVVGVLFSVGICTISVIFKSPFLVKHVKGPLSYFIRFITD